jgi:hypothetical protein
MAWIRRGRSGNAGTAAGALALDSRFSFEAFTAQFADLAWLLADKAVDDLAAALQTFVAGGSSAVVCPFDDNFLWASMIITVDESGGAALTSSMDCPAAEADCEMTKAAGEAVN